MKSQNTASGSKTQTPLRLSIYCVHPQVTATSSALLAARAAAQLAVCCMAAVGAARCAAVCVADSCLNNWLPAEQAVE